MIRYFVNVYNSIILFNVKRKNKDVYKRQGRKSFRALHPRPRPAGCAPECRRKYPMGHGLRAVRVCRRQPQLPKGVDTSGKDLVRACFLSYDPGALIATRNNLSPENLSLIHI